MRPLSYLNLIFSGLIILSFFLLSWFTEEKIGMEEAMSVSAFELHQIMISFGYKETLAYAMFLIPFGAICSIIFLLLKKFFWKSVAQLIVILTTLTLLGNYIIFLDESEVNLIDTAGIGLVMIVLGNLFYLGDIFNLGEYKGH